MSEAQNKMGESRESKRRRRARVIFAGLLVLLLCAASFGARAWLRPLAGKVWPKLFAAEAVAIPQQPQKVTVTLLEDGFNPPSITRSAGTFLLAVDNRSRVLDLSFHLLRDGKQGRVLEFRAPDAGQGLSQAIHLEAGEYTLREVNHPAWLFHITAQ